MKIFFRAAGLSSRRAKGFTLIEVLIVIGILAVLAGVVLVAVNPVRQFAQARDTQRASNIQAILNAVGQNIAENRGVFKCQDVTGFPGLPTEEKIIKSAGDGIDLYPCLVPIYLPAMPSDPNGFFEGSENYDTKYKILQTTEGRITVSAESETNPNQPISVTR